MLIVQPKVIVVEQMTSDRSLETIESIGRICYRSEDKIAPGSADNFVDKLVERKHEAMIEFSDMIFVVVADRGVTHELVRHRIASFAQESTRYCNYSKGGDVKFIRPFFFRYDTGEYDVWRRAARASEQSYLKLLEGGSTPQEARSVLINSTAAMIAIKMNLRELKHFLELRTAPAAHPQMRQVILPLLYYCKKTFPGIFCTIPNWISRLPKDNFGTNSSALTRQDLAELYTVKEPKDIHNAERQSLWRLDLDPILRLPGQEEI